MIAPAEPGEKYLQSYIEACREYRANGVQGYPFHGAKTQDIFEKYENFRNGWNLPAGVGGRSLLPAGGDGRKGIYRGKPHPPQTDRAFKTLRWTYWEKRKNWEFITCDGDNFVSASVMEHNGLVLRDKITNTIDGCAITARRYTKSL